MVKKLKYLLFLLPFFTISNVYAQSYQLSFNVFENLAGNFSSNIQCNNNQCIAYNIPLYNYSMNYEWGSVNSPTCSSSAIVSGILYSDNTSFGVTNEDFPWSRVYIVPTAGGQQYNCSFSVDTNGTSYVCTAPSLSSDFRIGFTFNDASSVVPGPMATIITRNVDINCDTSTGQIIENNNNNTQNIINNNTQNSQNIINNQNQNTQNIIDNQNVNNQQQIESQKICKDYDRNAIKIDGKYLGSNGTLNDGGNFYGVSDYIKINNTTTIKVKTKYTDSSSLCFYNVNKTQISCIVNNTMIEGQNITIPEYTTYIRFSIQKNVNRPQYTICSNGNQALSDDLNNLNDTLNSEATPNTNQDIEDMDDMVASYTPISDLITMPLTLIHAYINGINASCSPVNLGTLYGSTLTIPCLNLEQKFGSDLWSKIDVLFSIFMCYNIGMLFITAFTGITSLRDDFDSLYVPKHADTGYQPKHGGGS